MKQLFFVLFCLLATTFNLFSQATPRVVAEGFRGGLIGIEIDADGNIWATEHGTGNDDGKITIIDPTGKQTVFMTGLPSTYIQAAGEVTGSFRTYQMPNNRVMIVVGEGTNDKSESLLIVNKTNFSPNKPFTLADVEQTIKLGTFVHAQGFVQSDPFHAVWDANGNIYVADAGANSILKWTKSTGALSIVKTFDRTPNPLPFGPPVVDPVPTKVLLKPDGNMFVSQLTGFPFVPGAAKVFNLTLTGDLSVHAEGFTCLTDMNFDPKDKNLCVLQFGEFGMVDTTFTFKLGTAAVIKLLPNGQRQTIASGIGGLAPSFTFDGKGGLYVTDLVFGQILRYDLSTSAREAAPVSASVNIFPNPFSEQVAIEYELQNTAASVELEIFNLNGQRMARFDQGKQGAGHYTVQWDGTNGTQRVPPGTYVYRLTADGALLSGLIHSVK